MHTSFVLVTLLTLTEGFLPSHTPASPDTTLLLSKPPISSSSSSSSSVVSFDAPDEEKPKWAAGGVVSDLVNALIGIKPFFSLMKLGARQQLIGTAEQNGVPWRERALALRQKQAILDQYFESCLVDSVEYPEYYTQEFHAFEEGNLNWPAAYECEQATMSMALRVWPTESLSPKEAQDRLRYSFIDTVREYIDGITLTDQERLKQQNRVSSSSQSGAKPMFPFGSLFKKSEQSQPGALNTMEDKVNKAKYSSSVDSIGDLGCSVGVSTFYLSEAFPLSKVTGVDLSPQFLAVAKERQWSYPITSPVSRNVDFVHGQAENMEPFIASESKDLITACFIFHELPQDASRVILAEMFRITSTSGLGTVAITDNNPKSAVIQNLPPPIFTLMKSTEPWSDEYYSFDLEQAMRDAGFVDVITVETDPRHRTVLGRRSAE